MTYENVKGLMKKVEREFPELVSIVDIGMSYKGVPIQMLEFNYVNSTTTNKKAVLVTGAHHSRELTSISMNMYLILELCYGFVQRDPRTMLMLSETMFNFIPALNIDGFKYISD